MAATVRYIRQRDGVFYYERRVPEGVRQRPDRYAELFGGRPLFRRSLRTKRHADALAAAYRIEDEFASLVSRALDQPGKVAEPIATASVGRPLTNDDLITIRDRHRRLTSLSWQSAMLNADASPEHANELARMRDEREEDAARIRRAIIEPGFSTTDPTLDVPATLAKEELARGELDVQTGTQEFGLLVNAIRTGLSLGQRDIDALLAGEAMPRLTAPAVVKPACPSLAEAVELYLASKQLPPKTVADVRHTLQSFEALAGKKRLDAIMRADAQAFLHQAAGKVVGGRSAESVARPTARKTVDRKLGNLRAVVNFARDRGLYSGGNPFSGHKLDAWITPPDRSFMPAKRPFTVGELNKLFEHPWFTGGAPDEGYYWVPVVALFTGCRAGELGGLKLAEVRLDDPHPHLRIRDNEYRRTKGSYARSVPVLDALLELGFGAYVERVARGGAERLFPNWQSPRQAGGFNKDDARWANAPMIRAFNRTVIPAALGKSIIAGARREVTFHSFRGAFKTMLNLRGVPINIINEVVGHAKPELDRRYIGTIPIEETYDHVHKCRFVSLRLGARG